MSAQQQWAAARIEDSPYLASAACRHANVIERTCEFQPGSFVNADGAVDVLFAVRIREFECADCGGGCWPTDADLRRSASRRSRCTRPYCDCFTSEELSRLAVDPDAYAEFSLDATEKPKASPS